jgi:hypothetical protein
MASITSKLALGLVQRIQPAWRYQNVNMVVCQFLEHLMD